MKTEITILLFLFAVTAAQAADSTRTLTISTWPSHADLYPGSRPAEFVTPGAFETPARISFPEDTSIARITLFRPGYQDTTLDIRMKSTKDNYIMLMLQPETDPVILDEQQAILRHRTRRKWGKRIMLSSAIPLALSGLFAGIAQAHFKDADSYTDRISNSIIRKGDSYNHLVNKQEDEKESGKKFRKYAITSLCAGSAILLTGIILYF